MSNRLLIARVYFNSLIVVLKITVIIYMRLMVSIIRNIYLFLYIVDFNLDVNLDMTATSKKFTTVHVRIFSKPDNLAGLCCVSQYSPSDNKSPHVGVTKKEIISSISIIKILESFGYKLFCSYFETGQLFIFNSGRREEVFVYVTKQNAKGFEQFSLSRDKLFIKVKGSTIGGKSNDALYSKVNTVVNSIKKYVN